MNVPITSHIRRYRLEQGLSQAQLAKKVGISRQALILIETQRQIPSTTLSLMFSRVLNSSVEALFTLNDGPSQTLIAKGLSSTTGRVVLGRVDGELVAHPVQTERSPADGLIHGPNTGDSRLSVDTLETSPQWDDQVFVAGCAPILGLIAESVNRQPGLGRVNWQMSNSSQSLKMLRSGLVHGGGVHRAPSTKIGAHHQLARKTFPKTPMVLVHVAKWKAGLVMSPGNPMGVETGATLLREDLRWAIREPGASAHKLHHELIENAGGEKRPDVQEKVPKSHQELAMLINYGQADVGVAIEAVALQKNLDFIPIVEERFDLFFPRHRLEQPAIKRFIDSLSSRGVKQQLCHVPGYDTSECGHVFECTGQNQDA
ncbi:MAG: substrate-binding domain-containing protein [Myxococcota bacterium]|nr:substrate-binding domain-containing protein [Myxococcota bacterium]